MTNPALPDDPYNVIIAGVGGQGNVLASHLLGDCLVRKGLRVTVGETFGASQRGGSVMSHLRISRNDVWSPQIPSGRAHLVLALEPSEAFRVLAVFGNRYVVLLYNTRPVHPIDVISGADRYPSPEEVARGLEEISASSWPIDATDTATSLGSPVFSNVVMIGALAALHILPFDRDDLEQVLARDMTAEKVALNLGAFDLGGEAVAATQRQREAADA
jgi:indolepyruvate ferredoxin oxidoreductase beta subunit